MNGSEAGQIPPKDRLGSRFGVERIVSLDHVDDMEKLQKASVAIRKGAVAFGKALAPVMRRCAMAFNAFGETYYNVAKKEYRANVGKLPGSSNTKRLKKKRRKIVLSWYRQYLEYHGTTIYDSVKRKILDNAIFDGFKIEKHEQLCDGTFDKDGFKTGSTFLSSGQLYYFMTNFAGQTSSFFELNMDKAKCGDNSFGVYYSILAT